MAMAGMFQEHLRFHRPVLKDLRRQFYKVAQHLGARQALELHLGQQPMQAMTKFVEQRSDVVKAQQRGVGFGKVIVVDDDGQDAAVVPRLAAEHAHPGAAAFAGARKVVANEQANQSITAVAHLPKPGIRVVQRHTALLDKAQPEQALRAIKHSPHHVVQ